MPPLTSSSIGELLLTLQYPSQVSPPQEAFPHGSSASQCCISMHTGASTALLTASPSVPWVPVLCTAESAVLQTVLDTKCSVTGLKRMSTTEAPVWGLMLTGTINCTTYCLPVFGSLRLGSSMGQSQVGSIYTPRPGGSFPFWKHTLLWGDDRYSEFQSSLFQPPNPAFHDALHTSTGFAPTELGREVDGPF